MIFYFAERCSRVRTRFCPLGCGLGDYFMNDAVVLVDLCNDPVYLDARVLLSTFLVFCVLTV